MHDKVETVMLRRIGENRKSIERLLKRMDRLESQLVKINSKVHHIQTMREILSQDVEDREAYLRGDLPEE